MKLIETICFYALAFLVIVLVSVYTMDYLYFIRFPAVAPFGVFIFFVGIVGYIFIIYAQKETPQFICNRGHFSINKKEIMFLIWEYVTKSKDGEKKTVNERMAILPVGGIDSCGISPQSSSDYPIFIGPARYLEKVGDSYISKVVYELTPLNELPLYLIIFITNEMPQRARKKNIKIYYGEFSFNDGTATPENMNLLTEQRIVNKTQFSLYEENKELIERLGMKEKQRGPKVFISKDVKKVEEEE